MNRSSLNGGRALIELMQSNPRLGNLLQRIIDGVNATATNAAVSPIGQLAPPAPPEAISVKASGELVHVSITHNAPIQRGIQYFTEADTSPSFTNPIVIDHGASRTSHPFPLPTQTDGGVAQKWFFRSYSQYHGSPPSEKTVFGGASSPTGVTLTGTTKLSLLPSTGSGTAAPNGQQAGQGLGTFTSRAAQGPKRKTS